MQKTPEERMKKLADLARRSVRFAEANDDEILATLWVLANESLKNTSWMPGAPTTPEALLVRHIQIGRLAAADKDIEDYEPWELPSHLVSGKLEESTETETVEVSQDSSTDLKATLSTKAAQKARARMAELAPSDDEVVSAFAVVCEIWRKENTDLKDKTLDEVMQMVIQKGRKALAFSTAKVRLGSLLKVLSTAKTYKPTCGLNVGCE